MAEENAVIDIIVPVYRGLADTRRCLESVLAACNTGPWELVVIEDCSPEPTVVEYLLQLQERGVITLLRNESNRGFVASVNRGMALHAARDVVLLNSDTEVANDWLDRLRACAGRNPRAATLTPFTNAGTICSYPFEGWDGGVPGTLGLARLDRTCAAALAGRTVELPTAVGFCMYIRRACLTQVGAFDEASFGRGYGEENDFSLRAAKAGWLNLMCADVFVYHHGGVSFGAERVALMQQAERALLALHPDYNERLAAFFALDPVRPLRRLFDAARLDGGIAEAQAVLAEREAEIDGLRHALAEARRAAPPTPPLPPEPAPSPPVRPYRDVLATTLAEGARRLEASGRWGPWRRRLGARVLHSLAARTGRGG